MGDSCGDACELSCEGDEKLVVDWDYEDDEGDWDDDE